MYPRLSPLIQRILRLEAETSPLELNARRVFKHALLTGLARHATYEEVQQFLAYEEGRERALADARKGSPVEARTFLLEQRMQWRALPANPVLTQAFDTFQDA